MRALTLAELADEAHASLDLLEWLVERKELRPLWRASLPGTS